MFYFVITIIAGIACVLIMCKDLDYKISAKSDEYFMRYIKIKYMYTNNHYYNNKRYIE